MTQLEASFPTCYIRHFEGQLMTSKILKKKTNDLKNVYNM